MIRKFYLLLFAAILCLVVSGCGVRVLIPDMLLVKRAIALQITLDQKQVYGQLLGSGIAPEFDLGRVTVSQIKPMVIQNLESYRITGSYDLKLELPQRYWQLEKNPFELYLQRQQRGETWRLARPQIANDNREVIWLTYLIRDASDARPALSRARDLGASGVGEESPTVIAFC